MKNPTRVMSAGRALPPSIGNWLKVAFWRRTQKTAMGHRVYLVERNSGDYIDKVFRNAEPNVQELALLGCGTGKNEPSRGQDSTLKPSIAALSSCNLDREIEATSLEVNEGMQQREISVQEIPIGNYRMSKTWVLWRQDQTYLHYVNEMVENTLGGFGLERTYECGGGFPVGQYRADVSINGLSEITVFDDGSVNFEANGIGFHYDSSRDRIGSVLVNGIPTKDPGFSVNLVYSASSKPGPIHNLPDIFPIETVKLYRLSNNRIQVRTEEVLGNQKVNMVTTFVSTSIY